MRIIDERNKKLDGYKERLISLIEAGFVVKEWPNHPWADLYLPTKLLWLFTYNDKVGNVFFRDCFWIQITYRHQEVVNKLKTIHNLQDVDIHLKDV